MIIYDNMGYVTNSLFQKENFCPNDPTVLTVIDETDETNTTIIQKIKDNSPYINLVFDANGKVVGVEILPRPVDPLAYRQLRAAEYPSIEDQLDAFWKSYTPPVGSEAEQIKNKWQAVKDKYPKP